MKSPHRMNTLPWSYSVRRDPQGGIRVHRTWLKMVANPVLRLLGWRIVSVFVGERFVGYQLLPLTREIPTLDNQGNPATLYGVKGNDPGERITPST